MPPRCITAAVGAGASTAGGTLSGVGTLRANVSVPNAKSGTAAHASTLEARRLRRDDARARLGFTRWSLGHAETVEAWRRARRASRTPAAPERRSPVTDRYRCQRQADTRSRRLVRDDRVPAPAVLIRDAVTVDMLLDVPLVNHAATLDGRRRGSRAARGPVRRDRAARERAGDRQRVAAAAAAELTADRAADDRACERVSGDAVARLLGVHDLVPALLPRMGDADAAHDWIDVDDLRMDVVDGASSAVRRRRRRRQHPEHDTDRLPSAQHRPPPSQAGTFLPASRTT